METGQRAAIIEKQLKLQSYLMLLVLPFTAPTVLASVLTIPLSTQLTSTAVVNAYYPYASEFRGDQKNLSFPGGQDLDSYVSVGISDPRSYGLGSSGAASVSQTGSDSGTFQISDAGWIVTTHPANYGYDHVFPVYAAIETIFKYSFQSTSDANMRILFSTSQVSDTDDALSSFNIAIVGNDVSYAETFAPGSTQEVSQLLRAGNSYTLTIGSNSHTGGYVSNRSLTHSGIFNYSVNAIPEPATASLILAGLGLLWSAGIRKKNTVEPHAPDV